MSGRSPLRGSGLRPFGAEPQDASQAKPLVPNAADLLKLAGRCEQVTVPDRELEAALFREVGPVNEDHCKYWCKMDGRTDLTRDRYIAVWAPSYAVSLDAAASLLPHGALWEVEHKINIGTGGTFETPEGEPAKDFRAGVGIGDVPAQWTYGRSFATPALALCAAALKARAALAGEAATAVETPKSGSINEHATAQPERPNTTPILPKKERTK